MRFFTKPQLKGIISYSICSLVSSGAITIASTMIGINVGDDAADDYAKQNGCGEAYNFWNQRPTLPSSEACQESCKEVCDAANDLAAETIKTFALWPLGLTLSVSFIALSIILIRVCYVNNKKDYETDKLINSYKNEDNFKI